MTELVCLTVSYFRYYARNCNLEENIASGRLLLGGVTGQSCCITQPGGDLFSEL